MGLNQCSESWGCQHGKWAFTPSGMYTTELANAGTPIPTLQQQMRHADVRTTLEVYAHVLPVHSAKP